MVVSLFSMRTMSTAFIDLSGVTLALAPLLIDGLIQGWMLDPTAFALAKVGQLTVDAYLRGVEAYFR